MRPHEQLIDLEKHRITPKDDPMIGSTVADGRNGAFSFKHMGADFFVIVSDGEGWEHASVTVNRGRRTPHWEEMCFIRELFWLPEETVIQYHPALSQNVSFHDHCLHLWRPIDQDVPLPDPMMVGPTGPMIFKVQRPQFDSGGDYDQLLIYNESGGIRFTTHDPMLMELMGERLKVYVRATLVGGSPPRLTDVQVVEEQEW